MAAIAASAGLSDFVTSGILKKWICRPRPTHSDLAPLLHLVNGYTGGQYGFPSSHAANTVAVATSFLMIFYFLKRQAQPLRAGDFRQVAAVRFAERALQILVLLYVLLNCYSRMYLGVHDPLDILTGALIGLLFGYLLARLFQYTANRFLIKVPKSPSPPQR